MLDVVSHQDWFVQYSLRLAEVTHPMFMCKQCWEQYEDKDLAYTVILEYRLTHAAKDMYMMKFCSKSHVQEFLEQISNQQQLYVMTKKGKGGDKQFEAAFPLDLLLLVGSTKAS